MFSAPVKHSRKIHTALPMASLQAKRYRPNHAGSITPHWHAPRACRAQLPASARTTWQNSLLIWPLLSSTAANVRAKMRRMSRYINSYISPLALHVASLKKVWLGSLRSRVFNFNEYWGLAHTPISFANLRATQVKLLRSDAYADLIGR